MKAGRRRMWRCVFEGVEGEGVKRAAVKELKVKKRGWFGMESESDSEEEKAERAVERDREKKTRDKVERTYGVEDDFAVQSI